LSEVIEIVPSYHKYDFEEILGRSSVYSCSSSADSSRRRFKQTQFRTQEELW